MPDGPVAIVGGGPAGLAAADRAAPPRAWARCVIEREAEAGRDPAPRPPPGLRPARPAPGADRARLRAPLRRAGARAPGVELLAETMVTGWARTGALELTGPGRARDARAGGGRAGHRLPRAAALGAAGPGQPARGRDDHRDAPAARLPAAALPAGPARAGGRRRARELLGDRDARPRRRSHAGADHRAAAPPVAGAPFGWARALRYRVPVWTRTRGERDPRAARGWRRSS